MNSSFRGAVAQVQRASYEQISHAQRVTRLYRRALKVRARKPAALRVAVALQH